LTKQDTPLKAFRLWLARTPEAGALVGFVAVFLFFSLTADHFLEIGSTASTILTKQATSGIVAVGITILMISGEFDLSVGSILAVCALTFLSLIASNVPPPLALIIAVLLGMLMGLINGLLLVWTRIPSFIVTLGTLQAYRAIALTGIRGGKVMRYNDYFSDPPWIYLHPVVIVVICAAIVIFILWLGLRVLSSARHNLETAKGMGRLSQFVRVIAIIGIVLIVVIGIGSVGINQFHDLNSLVRVSFFDLLNGQIDPSSGNNFRMSIVWWALIVAIFTALLGQTRYGNAVFATGGNAGAARAQGIPVDTIRITNFVISGGLSALAGIIAVGRDLSVFPLQAQGLELEVIAASVIGGTLLSGGYGSIIGAVLGVIITGMLSTGLVLLKVPAEVFQGAIGVILIITVVLNTSVRGQNTLFSLKRLRPKGRTSQPVVEAAKEKG
jgi:ribose/xylose/arabinose/galactoside ABC-type transport system permease subunit